MQTSYKKSLSKNGSWPLQSVSPVRHSWMAYLYLHAQKPNTFGQAMASWSTGGWGGWRKKVVFELYLNFWGKCAVID